MERNEALISRIDAYLREARPQIVADIKNLVRIPSKKGSPAENAMFGLDNRRAMDTVTELWLARGMKDARVFGEGHYATAMSPGSGRCIGFFNHVDVVPEGTNWDHDPFDPVETAEYIIGRGAADNKNGIVASLYAAKAVRDLSLPVRSSILLFAGGDEETGMTDIAAFAAEQPQPDFSFVVDSMFPVCNGEKGYMTAEAVCQVPFSTVISLKGEAGNTVSARVADRAWAQLPADAQVLQRLRDAEARGECKVVVKEDGLIEASAEGISKHSSEPEGSINAIGVLAGVLAKCPELGESDCKILRTVADALSDPTGKPLGVDFSDSMSGKSYCICRSGETVDGKLKLVFNPRYCVSVTGDMVLQKLDEFFAPKGWSVQAVSKSDGYYIPKDDPRIVQLSQIYREVTGREDCEPQIIGGGTYARHLKNAVGFGPTYPDPLPEGHGTAHNPNETLVIDLLLEAIKMYILSIMTIDEILQQGLDR